jgi:hypothetical protein
VESPIDRAIRELWRLVEQVEGGGVAKRSDAASEARASVDDRIERAIADEQQARPGLKRDAAIARVVRKNPALWDVHTALVQKGVTRAAKAESAPAPKPSKHDTASRLVLQHAGELVRAKEYPDLISALRDKRMAPFLRAWAETSGT